MSRGHSGIVRLLLDRNVDTQVRFSRTTDAPVDVNMLSNAKSHRNKAFPSLSALQYAIAQDYAEVVDLLLDGDETGKGETVTKLFDLFQ